MNHIPEDAEVFDKPFQVGQVSAAVPADVAVTRKDRRDTIQAFHQSDSGNAEHFANLFGTGLRFDHRRRRWMLWGDHRWVPDVDAGVHRLALQAVRQMQRNALTVTDVDAKRKAMAWALSSESRRALDAAIHLATTITPIADAGTTWDADPWLLGVPNGVIDLHTGILRPGRPEDRITLSAGVPYDTEAICPRWGRFVDDVFGGDAALIAYVQKAVGYTLTGTTGEQVFFIEHGSGSNGKSTFTNALRRTMGDYAHVIPVDALDRDHRGVRNEVAALDGKRFILAGEIREGMRLDESQMKALTGEDRVRARFLFQEGFEFQPVGKFWLQVNHLPRVFDNSLAFWRRVRLIPFLRTFAVNPAFADALHAEAAGILAWAVRGCLIYQAEGLLPTPDAVLRASDLYQADSDPLADFLALWCVPDAHAVVGSKDLYQHYTRFADRQGLGEKSRLSATMFGRKMHGRFTKGRDTTTGRIFYSGVALRVPEAD